MKTRWTGKRVLIFGLGQFPQGSGVTAALWFAKRGARVTVTDMKTADRVAATVRQLRGKRNVTLVLGKHRRSDFLRADLIVRNPGVPWHSPYLELAKRRHIPVHSDVSLFLEACPAPVVGITGTRGKSTTSALAAAMLEASGYRTWLGGNILVSPLSFLHRVKPGHRVVLELSSFLTETLGPDRRAPQVAVITNLMRDHLNFYPDMKTYAAAKERIFSFQSLTSAAVVGRDNTWTRKMGARVVGRRYWWSAAPFPEENGAFLRGSRLIVRENGKERIVADLKSMPLPGEHNRANAAAAAMAAIAAGATDAGIRKALKSFRGLPNRQETVARIGGVRFVNDTTATTPDALLAALATFGSKKHLVLIAGGTDKNLDFRDVPKAVRRAVRTMILLPGSGTDKMVAAFRTQGIRMPAFSADSMDAAVTLAAGIGGRGDTVLLSPGCTSFGLFKNEFDRGERFREAVAGL
ncbi:UDP-N-acetylmuramoyl-L-alanine--D-glutamate ligase [Patescibacteria group bacterium]|nr:MAG: UDP-N-acetylmuramoyl-L-alanine--D-glutamate ligase [Patescibacteria group bacterium]